MLRDRLAERLALLRVRDALVERAAVARAGERVATRGGFLLKSQASKSQLGEE